MNKLCAVLVLATTCWAFYLPGVAPVDYPEKSVVPLKVAQLSSTKTQLPYEYYTLPFCRPEKIRSTVENLGEVLRGDRIQNSDYKILMAVDTQCQVLCRQKYSKKQIQQFVRKIKDEYRVNWLVDNLPAATSRLYHDTVTDQTFKTYEMGFLLGYTDEQQAKKSKNDNYFLNNHVSMTLLIHPVVDPADPIPKYRIVGFEVTTQSVNHKFKKDGDPLPSTCQALENSEPLLLTQGTDEIVWTYSTTFVVTNEIEWASRWDTYLYMTDDQIHWFSIINSLMIVLFLTGMVAMIMLRTLNQDFSRYNQLQDTEDAQEETGWKLVHGDVFRPPQFPMLLSVAVGSGVQLLSMTLITILFAMLGFLSPANRGGLLTSMLVLWVFMGVAAGYASSRNYKMLKGQKWKRNTLFTALLFPGILFSIFFTLNFFIWGQHSSGAVPFTTLLALLALWFGISTPLVFVGSYFGYKKKVPEQPVRTNQIPRVIPEQMWYMHPVFSVLMGGILPFGAVFIELFFILSSIWLHQFYYIFGFLFIVVVILSLTCAEISIVMCYFQLCSEDYQWWWRSFLTSAASSVYMVVYSLFYFHTKLDIQDFVPTLLYFGYTFIMCFTFFMVTGTIGYLSCLWFVRKIYSAVKVD